MEADGLTTGVIASLSVTTDVFNDLVSLKAKCNQQHSLLETA